MDPALLAVLMEVVLGEQRVQFDLVYCGHYFAVFKKKVEVDRGEIGDADRLDFSRRQESFHLGPGVEEGPVRLEIAFAGGEGGEEGVVAVWVERDGPVMEKSRKVRLDI